MTDRFKFRVWDKERQKFVQFTDYTLLDIMIDLDGTLWGVKTDYNDEMSHSLDYKKERYTLMQCTGLKDKNGKLIYEGDIVKTKELGKAIKNVVVADYANFVIVYKEAAFYMKNPNQYGTILGYFHDKEAKLEVIGNIYETPELIESEEE